MKKIIYLITFISLCISCKTQKNNIVNSSTHSNNDMQNKITIKDLDQLKPVIIKTDKGNETVYPVIIYTEDSAELRKHNIIIQSVSKSFITALIRKNELDKIYSLQSVKSISLPKTDYIINPKQDFEKIE
ncbi:hypothetical protein [Empedobacter tilapiae]